MMQETERTSLRRTARGIALRAGLLSMVTIVVSAWLFGQLARAASGLVKVAAGLLVLLIGGGAASYQVKKLQRRYSEKPRPELTS